MLNFNEVEQTHGRIVFLFKNNNKTQLAEQWQILISQPRNKVRNKNKISLTVYFTFSPYFYLDHPGSENFR